MADYPSDLRYTAEHEWVRTGEGTSVRVGITDYAAAALGDIVYVSSPTVGSAVAAGDSCGELESTKSVSDVYSPVSGVVSAVNEAIGDAPETVNTDPYGDGWLFDIDMSAPDELDTLLDAEGYQRLINE